MIRHILPSFYLFTLLSNIDATAASPPPAPAATVESPDAVAARTGSFKKARLSIEGSRDGSHFKKGNRFYTHTGEPSTLRVQAKPEAEIRWYLIFADLTEQYHNANPPWENNPYRWTGFGQIRYLRIELPEARNQQQIHPADHLPTARKRIVNWFTQSGKLRPELAFYQVKTGTFYFQVTVEDERGRFRSPGVEDQTERGLSTAVFQLIIREDETYLGYLKGFYNVPGVFGSVLSQSTHHIGADCADILMAAWSEFHHRQLDKNYNVQMLTTKLRQTAQADMNAGIPSSTLRWAEQVHPGDFIAVSYDEDAEKFHHIGALVSDANENGILDGDDTVLHAGPDALHESSLADGAFDGHIVILRNSNIR